MKKVLLLLLACLFLVPTVASCSGKNGNKTPTDTKVGENVTATETEVETDEWGREVEDTDFDVTNLDFEDETLTVLCAGVDETSYWALDPGLYKEPTDALEMALYRRNLQIEEDLGMKLAVVYKSGDQTNSPLNQAVENDAKAGTGEFDIVVNYAAYAVVENLRPYYIDLLNASTPYLQLDKPWYNQNFVENTQAFGHLYYIVGDYNLCTYNRLMATYVNRTLCLAEGITDGIDADDLYDLALDGDWTYEVLFEYANIYHDSNGDGNKDAGDIYGLLSNANCEAYDGFLYAFNIDLTTTNDDGTHAWNVAGNEKMSTAADMVINLYRQNGVWLIAKTAGAETTSAQQYKMFAEGHALFDIDVIYRYAAQNKAFRAMEDKYGLLPLPKYDSEQEEYGSGVQDSHSFTSIIKSSDEKRNQMRCAYLEYANYLSYQDSRPYYFERILKAQYLGTLKSAQVFDLILEHADFDFGEQYSFALESAKGKVWRGVLKNETTVTSAWETYKDTLNQALSNLDAWFLAVE